MINFSNTIKCFKVNVLKILVHYISSNNADLLKELTSFEGRLWNYRFSNNPKLVQESLSIYKQIIVVKSIPIVQEVYKNLLADSELSYETLFKQSNSGDPLINDEIEELQSENGIKKLNLVRNAETSLLFNLCVLAELGNASKSNLISV